MDNQEHNKQVMPPANFAVLGGGKIAYVRSLHVGRGEGPLSRIAAGDARA